MRNFNILSCQMVYEHDYSVQVSLAWCMNFLILYFWHGMKCKSINSIYCSALQQYFCTRANKHHCCCSKKCCMGNVLYEAYKGTSWYQIISSRNVELCQLFTNILTISWRVQPLNILQPTWHSYTFILMDKLVKLHFDNFEL